MADGDLGRFDAGDGDWQITYGILSELVASLNHRVFGFKQIQDVRDTAAEIWKGESGNHRRMILKTSSWKLPAWARGC